jgi:hypothetical protein
MRDTCPALLIPLGLIIRIIFGESINYILFSACFYFDLFRLETSSHAQFFYRGKKKVRHSYKIKWATSRHSYKIKWATSSFVFHSLGICEINISVNYPKYIFTTFNFFVYLIKFLLRKRTACTLNWKTNRNNSLSLKTYFSDFLGWINPGNRFSELRRVLCALRSSLWGNCKIVGLCRWMGWMPSDEIRP